MKPELPEECRGCFGRTGEWSLVGEGGGGGGGDSRGWMGD